MIYAIGIDPGAKDTGIVLRHSDAVLYFTVVTNPHYPRVTQAYLDEVRDEIRHLIRDDPDAVIAIEGVGAPNPHLGMISVVALLGTAQVLGAVRGRFLNVIVVDPGNNGSMPLAFYPSDLIGPRETKTFGSGVLRHCRSAYDVAGKAHLYQFPTQGEPA